MNKRPLGDDEYDEKEAQERFEKALRGGLKTSPKPLKDVRKPREDQKKKFSVRCFRPTSHRTRASKVAGWVS
jgi:hypothetical protein